MASTPSDKAKGREEAVNSPEPRPSCSIAEEVRRLRKICQVSEDAYIWCEPSGQITTWSHSAERIFGYDAIEGSKLCIGELFMEGGGEAGFVLEMASLGEPVELKDVRWKHKNGSEMLVSVKAIHDEGHDGSQVLVIARDTTQRRRNDEQLRLFESVVTNTNDGVVITDPNVGTKLGPTILYVNDAFLEVTGYSREEVLGKSPRILYGPETDPVTLEHIKERLAERQPVRVEIVNYSKKGRGYWVDLSMVPAFDETGALTHLIAVEREITARKLAEFMEADQRAVLEMIVRGAELSDVLLQLITMIERQEMGVKAALVLRAGGGLRHLIAPQVDAELMELIDSGLPGMGMGWISSAMHRQGVSCVTELASSDNWRRLAADYKGPLPSAVWAVPIGGHGEDASAVLVVYSDHSRPPTEGETALLEMAARLAAIGMEQRQLSQRLIHQAQHDALTQLPNRYLFEVRLRTALEACGDEGENVALLCIDLDRFKQINDTLGHAVGDTLLVEVAGRLAQCTRSSDTLARMGGDEFVLILSRIKTPEVALEVAARLVAALKEPFVIQGYELVVTTSIGIGIYPQDGEDATTLLKNADSALYHAKGSGRNTFKCFSPRMNAMTFERLELENELRRALDRSELLLHYQPQVDLETLEVTGCEALVRWQHHRLGMVSPGEFIPLAEEVGMIIPIGQWVLEEACRQKVAWEEQGLTGLRVSVNVSALQFGHDEFIATVARALEQTGLDDCTWLDLEVTESLLAQDVNLFAQRLSTLREMGVTVSIDDFGTGYSSLARLQRLPLDAIKIDHSFTRSIEEEGGQPVGDGVSLVRSVVTLGHNLGLEVVAEGVETEVQLAFLQSLGCDRAQGYLLSRPIPADIFFERFAGSCMIKLAG